MVPKKTIADHFRARLSPIRGSPEEGGDEDHEELNPPLNYHGATEFDKIVGTPTRKDNSSVIGSASVASIRATTNLLDDFILQQSVHQEQLKQVFLLVSSLWSKIEAVVKVVTDSSGRSKRVEPPEKGPSH